MQSKLDDEDVELMAVGLLEICGLEGTMWFMGGLFSHSTQLVIKASKSLIDF